MKTLILIFSLFTGSNAFHCTAVNSFEHRCISLPYDSAYVSGSCFIAIRNSSVTNYQDAVTSCQTARLLKTDTQGSLATIVSTKHKEEIESHLIIQQTGYYFVNQNSAIGNKFIPDSGQSANPIGYICQYVDNVGCPTGWEQFRDKCYKSFPVLKTRGDARRDCASNDADLPRIVDDDQNQYIGPQKNQWTPVNETFPEAESIPIWLLNTYKIPENFWSLENQTETINFWRFWSSAAGPYSLSPSAQSAPNAVLFTNRYGINTKKAQFGYWGAISDAMKLPYVCERDVVAGVIPAQFS